MMEEAISAHGWEQLDAGVVSFRQENVLYRVLRDGDASLYSRTFRNGNGERVYDVLTGNSFTRTINDQEVPLGQDEVQAYSDSIRSVVFLVMLPYVLQDADMQQKYIGNVRLHGQPYHKVRITFPARSGKRVSHPAGSFLLWIHRQHHTLDYLVYSPRNDGKGNRFAQAVNPREVGGIRFQDYNYYTTKRRISPARLDYAFEAGKLDKVSETKIEDIKVSDLPSL